MYPTEPERRDMQTNEAWPTPDTAPMPTSASDDNVFRTPVPGDSVPTTRDSSRRFDPWNFPAESGLPSAQDIIGYHVEATDGRCGKVEEVHGAANGSFLVVDTGPWIFGHKAMLPGGVVTHVDHVDRNVYVDRTKDEIKNSPEVEPGMYDDATRREKVEGYYATYYGFPPGGTAR